MKIRYTGTAGVRIVEPYRWDESNGYVQDVTDPAILENLLTYPKPEFEAVEEMPVEEIIPEAGQGAPVKKLRKERKSNGIQ
jgi:hypothetical protein